MKAETMKSKLISMPKNESLSLYPHSIAPCLQGLDLNHFQADPDYLHAIDGIFPSLQKMESLLHGLLASHLHNHQLLYASALSPQFHGWLQHALKALQTQGYVTSLASPQIAPHLISTIEAQWESWKQSVIPTHAFWQDIIFLVEAMLAQLPAILRGDKLATDVLFANASMDRLESVYKLNPRADFYNHAVASIVQQYLAQRTLASPNDKIRILEIGAGTGGTTNMLEVLLRPQYQQVAEYCYTDLSKAFLLHAKERYKDSPIPFDYQIFNVEEGIDEQAIQANHYDVVVATNVLHATKNIRTTLRHAKRALRKHGIVVINEMLGNGGLFNHLTFGLTKGWWLFEDQSMRVPGGPGLSPKNWQRALQLEGFYGVARPCQKYAQFEQEIYVAASDGVVRKNTSGLTVSSTSKPLSQHQNIQNKKPQTNVVSPVLVEAEPKGKPFIDVARRTVMQVLCNTLQMDQSSIKPSGSFADYGMDSILGIRFIQDINEALSIDLDNTVIFDYGNLEKLSGFIADNFAISVSQATVLQPSVSQPASQSFGEPASVIKNDTGPSSFVQGSTPSSEFASDGVEDVNKNQNKENDAIAIIGMSGRFASAKNIDALWQNLINGDDLVSSRAVSYSYNRDPQKEKVTLFGGFLEDADVFDPRFFSISAHEAKYMDPQQRIFLEESWKALEDAGYAGASINGENIGVYVGCSQGGYLSLMGEQKPAHALWGNLNSLVAARIAYYLDLKGPAITIDTACSSSLLAIKNACESLLAGDISAAITGGIFYPTTPDYYIDLFKAGMTSPTGHCYTFDYRADGFVPAEGAGALVLRRLSDAVADGDHIHGVIRGYGSNQDGSSNGITAPSALSQESLQQIICEKFAINPEHIQLVEAHGTGTSLGDPIEFNALKRHFERYTQQKQFCALGSIKSSLGHAQAAAGVVGVIKVLLAMRHKTIPPSMQYESSNPSIQFDNSPFYVTTSAKPWVPITEGSTENPTKGLSQDTNQDLNQDPSLPRTAVVSSFGISGTNAQLVIQEYLAQPIIAPVRPAWLFALSARTADQLRQQVQQIQDYCQQNPNTDAGHMSYTLMTGRKWMSHRLTCVAAGVQELQIALQDWLQGSSHHSSQDKSQGFPQEQQTHNICTDKFVELQSEFDPALLQAGEQGLQALRSNGNAAHTRQALQVLASLYVKGFPLDYAALFDSVFDSTKFARIPLPVYPFGQEHYWIPEKVGEADEQPRPHLDSQASKRPQSYSSPQPLLATGELVLVTPEWQEVEPNEVISLPNDLTRQIVLCGWQQEDADVLSQSLGVPCLVISKNGEISKDKAGDQSPAVAFEFMVSELLTFLQKDYFSHSITSTLIQVVVPRNIADLSGLQGLLRSVEAEQPLIKVQTIAVAANTPFKQLSQICHDYAGRGYMMLAQQVHATQKTQETQKAKLLARHWRECEIDPSFSKNNLNKSSLDNSNDFPWHNQGVYLITGGTGGVGQSLMQTILQQTPQAKVIIAGRNNLYPVVLPQGAHYVQMDLGSKVAVKAGIQQIVTQFGGLNGVLHCAGVVQDAFIRNKDLSTISDVLTPKVNGVMHLDAALVSVPLDFMILFSSLSAAMGNVGQADYAAANGFMDGFAHARQARVKAGKASGITVSINWQLWQDSGMDVDQATREQISRYGMHPLPMVKGVQAMSYAVKNNLAQVMVFYGDAQRIREEMIDKGANRQPELTRQVQTPSSLSQAVDISQVAPALMHKITEILADITEIPLQEIDIQEPFENFGLDSVMVTRLNSALTEYWGMIYPKRYFTNIPAWNLWESIY